MTPRFWPPLHSVGVFHVTFPRGLLIITTPVFFFFFQRLLTAARKLIRSQRGGNKKSTQTSKKTRTIYGSHRRKALQGEIKNVTDPRAAAVFNTRECLEGAQPRPGGGSPRCLSSTIKARSEIDAAGVVFPTRSANDISQFSGRSECVLSSSYDRFSEAAFNVYRISAQHVEGCGEVEAETCKLQEEWRVSLTISWLMK